MHFKIPPPVKELVAFEPELTELVKNIKFWKVKKQLPNQLKKDIKTINQSDKTLTFTDKSSKMYRLTKKKKKNVKMRRNAITTYKKTNTNIKKRMYIKGKQIMENADKEILERMNINSKNTCFITLTDHKKNFFE